MGRFLALKVVGRMDLSACIHGPGHVRLAWHFYRPWPIYSNFGPVHHIYCITGLSIFWLPGKHPIVVPSQVYDSPIHVSRIGLGNAPQNAW